MKTLLSLILLSGTALAQFTPVAQMPNAYKVCDEGCTITSVAPAAVLQFGTGNTWGPTFSISTSQLPLLVSYQAPNTILSPADPAPGVVKEIDVQQTAAPQTVVYTLAGVPTTVTVPALPPPPQPVINIPVWVGPMLPCWSQKVTAKLPDGTDGASYYAQICGPIS